MTGRLDLVQPNRGRHHEVRCVGNRSVESAVRGRGKGWFTLELDTGTDYDFPYSYSLTQ